MQPTQEIAADTYLTPARACARLSISERTLWRYQDDGRIVAHRLPSGHRRFLASDVEALITRGGGE